jgi:hypothetical protein
MQAMPTLERFIKSDSSTKRYKVTIELPPLVPGSYSTSYWIGSHNTETYDWVESVVSFEIAESPTPGRSFHHTRDHGYIVPLSSVHPA